MKEIIKGPCKLIFGGQEFTAGDVEVEFGAIGKIPLSKFTPDLIAKLLRPEARLHEQSFSE